MLLHVIKRLTIFTKDNLLGSKVNYIAGTLEALIAGVKVIFNSKGVNRGVVVYSVIKDEVT